MIKQNLCTAGIAYDLDIIYIELSKGSPQMKEQDKKS